ncbi:MAG: hypothetical protein BWY70_01004 [Bacteroidetes bacterium ADurb.Bin408]|nr:MAG: hypothetical protein BWY70_01004 [Bacteroidetes bacterium ADurb.Bin408]
MGFAVNIRNIGIHGIIKAGFVLFADAQVGNGFKCDGIGPVFVCFYIAVGYLHGRFSRCIAIPPVVPVRIYGCACYPVFHVGPVDIAAGIGLGLPFNTHIFVQLITALYGLKYHLKLRPFVFLDRKINFAIAVCNAHQTC